MLNLSQDMKSPPQIFSIHPPAWRKHWSDPWLTAGGSHASGRILPCADSTVVLGESRQKEGDHLQSTSAAHAKGVMQGDECQEGAWLYWKGSDDALSEVRALVTQALLFHISPISQEPHREMASALQGTETKLKSTHLQQGNADGFCRERGNSGRASQEEQLPLFSPKPWETSCYPKRAALSLVLYLHPFLKAFLLQPCLILLSVVFVFFFILRTELGPGLTLI